MHGYITAVIWKNRVSANFQFLAYRAFLESAEASGHLCNTPKADSRYFWGRYMEEPSKCTRDYMEKPSK